MAINKPLDQITAEDLAELQNQQVPEDRTLDYKRDLVGSSDDDKREFRADVSSFANAAGGHLIFGIDEADGVPTDVCGVDGDPDAEILRLENMARENIKPRLPYLASHAVRLASGRHCIVIRIRKSWSLPHAVINKSYMQFFSRSSKGKYQLDVPEIRAAFLLSESTTDRIRQFRIDRLSRIVARETPIPLNDAPILVFHLVPMSAFESEIRLDPLNIAERLHAVRGNLDFGYSGRFNMEGLVWHTGGEYMQEGQTTSKYVQFFRNGVVEAVDAFGLGDGGSRNISGLAYDQRLVNQLPGLLECQQAMGITPPVFLMVSMLHVKGFTILPSHLDYAMNRARHPIDREDLLFSDAMIQDFGIPAEDIMKPTLDELWNAAGWPHSLSYTKEGKWDTKKQR